MVGAIIGDIVGSRFEFHNIHTKKFFMFTPGCHITDDSIVTKGISVRECVEDAFKVNLDRHPNVSKVVAVSKGKIVGAFDIAGYKRYKSGRTHIDTKPLYWKAKKEIEQKLNVKRKYGDRSAVRYKTFKK